MPDWLVSSAGRRGHLVQLLREQCARDGGTVTAIDASPLSAAGHLADHFEVVPPVADQSFVPTVLEICRRRGIDHVLPTIDPELPVYAAHAATFASAGARVWISAPATVALSSDKWKLFGWLREHDFPTPATFEISDAAWRNLDGPVIAKPRRGSASQGIVRAPSAADLDPRGLGPDYLVQALVDGYEVTVDVAVDHDGRVRGIGARRRLEVRAGEVAKARTIAAPDLVALTERFVAAAPGAYGVLNLQFVVTATAAPTLIELNARLGGGYPLSRQAGFNVFDLLTRAGLPRTDARAGVTMLRYDAAVFCADTDFDAVPRCR